MAVGLTSTTASSNVQGTAAPSFTITNYTVSGSNPCVVLVIGWGTGGSTTQVSSVTWSGTGTPAKVVERLNNSSGITIYVIPAPAGTNQTITVTFDATAYYQAQAFLLNSADQTTPCPGGDAIFVNGDGTTDPLTGTCSNLTANDMVIGGGANAFGGDDPRWVTGTETYYDNDSNVNLAAGYHAGTGSVSVNWGSPSTNSVMAAVRVVAAAAAGQTVAISQITETDLSQAMGKLKTLAQGQSSETDISQTLTRLKTVAFSQATETDLSQNFSGTVTVAINQSTESDVVFTLDRMKTSDLGQVTETDASQANAIIKLKSIGSVTETDTAQEFLVAKFITVTAVVETDASLQILVGGAPLVIEIGQITETDIAQTFDEQKTLAIGQSSETDESQAAAAVKFATIEQINEIDDPQAFLSLKTLSLTGSEETDAAQAQGVLKIGGTSRAIEIDVAQLMTVVGGALGSTVLIYGGMGGPGVTEHQGISQPTLILELVGGDQYNVTKTHQISDDNLNSESYLVDGELP